MLNPNSWQEARESEEQMEVYLRNALLDAGRQADIVASALNRRRSKPPMSESQRVEWFLENGPPVLSIALRHLQRRYQRVCLAIVCWSEK